VPYTSPAFDGSGRYTVYTKGNLTGTGILEDEDGSNCGL
jgi:hypothetical protein